MTRPEMQQLSHQATAVHGGHFSALAHSEGQPQGHLIRLLTPPHQICTAAPGDGSVANCSPGDQCHRSKGARPDDFRSNMVALWRSQHAPTFQHYRDSFAPHDQFPTPQSSPGQAFSFLFILSIPSQLEDPVCQQNSNTSSRNLDEPVLTCDWS